MILSMSNQAWVFLMTVCTGFFVGFVYDWFRVLRKLVKHPNFLTYIEDAVYWIFVSLVTFYVLLNKNYGEVRGFSVLGAFLGMCLYFLILSRLFMKVSLTIIDFIKKVLLLLFRIITAPFRLLYKLLLPPVRFCKNKLINSFFNTKKVLHKTKNYAKMKSRKLVKEIKIITKKV